MFSALVYSAVVYSAAVYSAVVYGAVVYGAVVYSAYQQIFCILLHFSFSLLKIKQIQWIPFNTLMEKLSRLCIQKLMFKSL